jgi:ABC-type nitrate/sulfonate/bicarbonate transport system ATPase subunit
MLTSPLLVPKKGSPGRTALKRNGYTIAGLPRHYYSGETALFGVGLDVANGKFLALLGAGKTRLLRLVAGLERSDPGAALIDGKNARAFSAHVRKLWIGSMKSMVWSTASRWYGGVLPRRA